MTPNQADVLGSHIASEWVQQAQSIPEVKNRFPEEQAHMRWPHEEEGISIPMPQGGLLQQLKTEFYQRHEGQDVGPVTRKWRDDIFAWAQQLKSELFGTSKQVTGLWSKAHKRFRRRLQVVRDKDLVREVMQEVRHGVRMPFSKRPQRIFQKRNHPDLAQRSAHVYEALREQLDEQSLEPFTFENGAPKGLFSLRWVAKSDPNKVRLTLNGRPINPNFPREACTIELETHRELRTEYRPGHMFIGFDLHNGFFNQQYVERDRDWVCFRIHKSELKPEHVRRLQRDFPDSWRHGYVYFRYRGLVMGLSPSCQQLARVNQAILRAWRCFRVQGIKWDATTFIDDLMSWALGTFEGALELSLRLLTEQVCLGFSVNLNNKTTIVPTYFYCHIGVCISSSRMRFSLPSSRVEKMRACLLRLQASTKVGKPVSAKLVARFIGQLWSASIVCYRAVAIMARGMVRTLANMIRSSEAMDETNPNRLRYILKRIWGGNVIWTRAAQKELEFWLRVNFGALSAPISHDAWSLQVVRWVTNPATGKIAEDVKVFAVDTSDAMSGGGEFIRDGGLWKMRNGMAVRLAAHEIKTSSTLRELLGLLRLDLAIIPDGCTKAIVVLDSQAAVVCILRGSRVEELQRVVQQIYLRQLSLGRVLWPVWARRCTRIIQICDDRSRFIDNHTYSMAAAVFWRANEQAKQLWGRGFQVDTCADMHNVQPVDRSTKLPFYSRWTSPHASATDMLQQNWHGKVNWCNPPFALIARILALLRHQQACAALVVPKIWHTPWVRSLRNQQQNILGSWTLGPATSLLFLDFARHPPSSAFTDSPPAEELPKSSRLPVTYLRLPQRSV